MLRCVPRNDLSLQTRLKSSGDCFDFAAPRKVADIGNTPPQLRLLKSTCTRDLLQSYAVLQSLCESTQRALQAAISHQLLAGPVAVLAEMPASRPAS